MKTAILSTCGSPVAHNQINNKEKTMKNKEQIELANELIRNLQDYVELAKVQKKLKVESVDMQISNVENFVKVNVKSL